MDTQQALSQWVQEVSSAFAHLSRPQARVLAYWSLGIILAGCCGITAGSACLALLLGGQEGSWRQRLREWCYEAGAKKGGQRRQLEVSGCCAALLGGILRCGPLQEGRLALALDASQLGDRFTVLALCVLYRGGAIPVAWKILPAHAKGEWHPYWIDLLERLVGQTPAEMLVVVLADRGLYARWLFEQIQQMGWHPLLRINTTGLARRLGQEHYEPLAQFAPRAGTQWSGRVCCFQGAKSRLECTLLACWQPGYEEAWLLLTDLAVSQVQESWYAMRGWIERGFRDDKRGGWQWQRTQMRDPERVERLWLVMAVATWWTVRVGAAEEAEAGEMAQAKPAPRLGPRRLSCLRRGLLVLRLALVHGWQPPERLPEQVWPAELAPPRVFPLRQQRARQKARQRVRDKLRRRQRRRRASASAARRQKNLPL